MKAILVILLFVLVLSAIITYLVFEWIKIKDALNNGLDLDHYWDFESNNILN